MERDAATLRSQIPDVIVEVCRALVAAGHEAWLVGGAIRDLLLGRPASDFDVATSAPPTEVTRVFGRKRTIPTGEKHGTVTVLLPNVADPAHAHVEVTTFRGEGAYSDGRRPDSVAFVSDLVEDLRRRDFTMNAIAFDPLAPRLADPWGGVRDLDARLIRAVGDPVARFGEDGLRVMRAVRFAAQLGFALDESTARAIPGALGVLRKVSQERVRDELVKLLASPRPSLGLAPLATSGIRGVVLRELDRLDVATWSRTLRAIDATPGVGPDRAILRFAALLVPSLAAPALDAPFVADLAGAQIAADVGRRLRLSNQERERVAAIVQHRAFSDARSWTGATVRRFLARVGTRLLPDLLALRTGALLADGLPTDEVDALRSRVDAELAAGHPLRVTELALTGADVMRLGAIPPSRAVGMILQRLLERVLDEPALNTRERLAALLPEVARDVQNGLGGSE